MKFFTPSDGLEVVPLGKRQINSRAYVARFNFSGSDQQKKVSMLSGGERNRVHLSRMLKEEANVLLLDEPTNDLDVNTMRALEEALENFAGLRLRVTARWSGSRETTLNMKQTERPVSALPQISPTASSTGT
jgi:ATPase subunit of ABC transporter with duplicated ATPase domains